VRHASLEARLLANSVLDPRTECWVWTGRLGPRRGGGKDGRMNFRANGRHVTKRAHRVSYEEFKGPIPEGLEVDHTCVNSCCINPAHLEAVTGSENITRMHARRRQRENIQA
jgi:hypothetical protein